MAEDGETGTLTASEDGIVDYSMLEGASHIRIETETGYCTNGLSAVQPDAHTHAYVLNVWTISEKVFRTSLRREWRGVCGALHMTYTNENSEQLWQSTPRGKRTIPAANVSVMIFADAEQISI
ncbi:MAG: hypothetical protein ACLRSW_06370 [Christensenellaceae bacterium]